VNCYRIHQKSLNFIYPFKFYSNFTNKNVSWLHFSWPTQYSRQASASGLWRQRLERSANTRDIRTVTRGLQTTSQDIPFHSFISEHFYLTYFLSLSVDLAIANVIYATLKMLLMMMMMTGA